MIDPGAPPLAEGVGLYVHTVPQDGESAYAVAALDPSGVPEVWIGGTDIVGEAVGTLQPVVQSREIERTYTRTRYVHWAPHGGADDERALCNRPGQSFNFIVREPLHRANPTGAVFVLHGGGGSYANQILLSAHPDLVIVSPDSVIPGDPAGVDRIWDAWYGYNENVGTSEPVTEGGNVDYTTRRLRYMATWLCEAFTTVDPARLFLRGSSMGGVGTVFSAILLRDLFAGGVAIVPRFDYGAKDVAAASFDTFATRWGPLEENVASSDGIGVFDRLDAGFLATTHPEWDFAPVWVFNGRNDEAVGWSEKIPFYETMTEAGHGWAFFWDLRAHGGQSPFPRAWREDGTEEAIFGWMVENVRLDQSYPAFSNCTIDDDLGTGDREDGDPIGTINGYLRWDPATTEDAEGRWSIEIRLAEKSPTEDCTVDVTARRRQLFRPEPGTPLRFAVRSASTGGILLSGETEVDPNGLVTVPEIPITVGGVRLIVETP